VLIGTRLRDRNQSLEIKHTWKRWLPSTSYPASGSSVVLSESPQFKLFRSSIFPLALRNQLHGRMYHLSSYLTELIGQQSRDFSDDSGLDEWKKLRWSSLYGNQSAIERKVQLAGCAGRWDVESLKRATFDLRLRYCWHWRGPESMGECVECLYSRTIEPQTKCFYCSI
jgi:hypothetical protein